MPRGQHKQWFPSLQSGVVKEDSRFVNPMPRGSHPDHAQQHRGRELVATEQDARGGYTKRSERSIADFWSVKGAPIDGKGKKAHKRVDGRHGGY